MKYNKLNEKGISIILPAFNEEKNIKFAIEDIENFIKILTENYEIIVINDGSTDGTKITLKQIASSNKKLKVINYDKNMGYGYALKNGFNEAKFEYLFFTDSDRQFDISNIWYMLPYMNDFDIVIGYRIKRNDSLKRIIASKGYNLLCKFIFKLNIRDIDCAFKMFNKKIFDIIKIESDRFFVNTEILAKACRYNFSIIEIPVLHFPRKVGYSSVCINDIFRTLRELAKLYFKIKK